MAIKIDKEKCIGCGTCAVICEKVFKMNEEEMKAEVIDPEAEGECVGEAIESCPTKAISRE